MEIASIIKELGGGLAAVVIVALAWVCWQLYRRMIEVQDRELGSTREYTKELAEIARDNGNKIEGMTRVIDGLTRMLEKRDV